MCDFGSRQTAMEDIKNLCKVQQEINIGFAAEMRPAAVSFPVVQRCIFSPKTSFIFRSQFMNQRSRSGGSSQLK